MVELAKSPVNAYIFSGPPAFPSIGANIGSNIGADLEEDTGELGDLAPPPLLRYAAVKFAASLFDASGSIEYHPNFRLIEPEGRTFRVEDVEAVIREAHISPLNPQEKKIIVCDRFHTAVEGVSTRLLKVIEEPPEHTILILLAEDQLPLTIVSRCIKMEIPPLPQNKVLEYLEAEQSGAGANGTTAAQNELIARAAAGDLGRAHFFIHSGHAQKRIELWDQVYEVLEYGPSAGAVIAEQTAVVRDFLDEVLEGLESKAKSDDSLKREKRRIRDTEIRFGFGLLASRYHRALIGDADPSTTITSAAAKIKALNQAGNSLGRNPNEPALFTDLFFNLAHQD